MELAPLVLSFQVAIAATAVSALVGIGLGALLASPRTPARNLLDILLTVPMVLPPTVLGYYVLVTVGRRSAIGQAWEAITGAPIVFTAAGAVIAATVGSLPIVIKSARAAIEAVDPSLVGAARTLGAGPLRTFITIELPLALPGIAAGLVLAFARALGDFGVTLMVAGDIPGETQTAALAIYDAIQAGRDGEAAGMIAVLSAIALATLALANKLTARRRDA